MADSKNDDEAIKLGLKDDPKRFEPYMMKDKNGNATGVMKHPGKTAEEHKYFKDGVETDKFGTPVPQPDPPAA